MQYQVLPVVHALSDYRAKEVSWLWPGRVPRGKVTLLCGDPGVGKSMVTMDMAARVSRGLGWPEETGDTGHSKPVSSATTGSTGDSQGVSNGIGVAGSVLVMSGEDDPFDTIRPRVERAGGDVSRVHILRAVREGTGEFGVSLDRDIDAVSRAVSGLNRPRLVVIDPISSFLGRVNSYSNAAVRGLLTRLGMLASRHGVAVVCVTHVNKTLGSGTAAYRVMGSLAFAAAPRVVWRVARLVDGRMGMVCVKSNIGGVAGPIAFSIEGGSVAWSRSAPAMEVEEAAAGALEEACEFLRGALVSGARMAAEVIAEARRAGITGATLKRAKGVVGVASSHGGTGRGRGWVWELCEARAGGNGVEAPQAPSQAFDAPLPGVGMAREED